MHGGVAKEDLGKENVEAVKKAAPTSRAMWRTCRPFGVPAVVAINRFVTDTEAELAARRTDLRRARRAGGRVHALGRWRQGTEKLARHVVELAESGRANFRTLYPDDMPLWDKVRTIAPAALSRAGHHRRPEGARSVQGAAEEAMGTIRSAWPRRSTASRPIPTSRARRQPRRADPRGEAIQRRRDSLW
jgi:formyltetrahydrofolate synthetase